MPVLRQMDKMRPIIEVENVSKEYGIGGPKEAYGSLREAITRAARSPVNRLRKGRDGHTDQTFLALDDVSLTVEQGDRLGIIGNNGAGKTTLLKILSRVTWPTKGRVQLFGRVGSLLEVGTGFHPELTGRENIYLNGAVLGMKRQEIANNFDAIIDFAEIGKFLDVPVKRYSSGMYTRLAFSVAAHLEPEILLVDEVLAVGDARFQRKCLGKLSDVSKHGRTVIFVSHNMTAVQNLCTRGAWLHQGRIVKEGAPSEVVSGYLKSISKARQEVIWDDILTAPGNDRVRIHRACVRPQGVADELTVETPLVIEFEFWNLQPNAHLNLSLVLFNEQDLPVFSSGPTHERVWHGRPFPVGRFRSACYVPGNLLNDGYHRVQLIVIRDQSVPIFIYDNALVFEVWDTPQYRGPGHEKVIGIIRPRLEWQTEMIEAGTSSMAEEALLEPK